MATTVSSFIVTIPAGTLPFTPHEADLDVGTNEVETIRWRVPPGPRGNMGFWLAMGGVQIVPDTHGTAVVADNEVGEWVLNGLPNTGAWQLMGYNIGTHDHSVYLEFFTTPVVLSGSGGSDLLTGFPRTDADIPGMWLT